MWEIYEIKNIETNSYYIGMTKNGFNRYRQHVRALKIGKCSNSRMQLDFSQGFTNLIFKVVDIAFTLDEASKLEASHIKNYREKGYRLYNLVIGGYKVTKGYRQSEYAKQVASKVHSQKIGDKNSFYGKQHTEETKQLLSRKNKGRVLGPFSEERKRKMSLASGKAKKVIIDDTVYHSMTEAERILNIPRKKIAKMAKDEKVKNVYFI